MAGGQPGLTCSTRVGDDWIDSGTLCRAKAGTPGSLGAPVATPAKADFDKAHAYSLAPEARRKRAIDLEIIGGDYSRGAEVAIDNGVYLRRLIQIGSSGHRQVRSKVGAGQMQFFIVSGGAEGFLPEGLRAVDARKTVTSGADENGKAVDIDFDENDLLVVFDAGGALIASARLRRPTKITGIMSRGTAASVFAAWDGKHVFIYRNTSPGWVPYLGLGLDDGFRDGSANDGKGVEIDIHKQEQTLGCYFIEDPATPALGTPELDSFEPALIKKILAAKGVAEAAVTGGRIYLGTMQVVRISY